MSQSIIETYCHGWGEKTEISWSHGVLCCRECGGGVQNGRGLVTTKEGVLEALKSFSFLYERAGKIAQKLYPDTEQISFADTRWDKPEEATFTASWEENYSCHCHPEYGTEEEEIPLRYLWESDWEKILEEEKRIAEAKTLRERQRKENLRIAQKRLQKAQSKVYSAQAEAEVELEEDTNV